MIFYCGCLAILVLAVLIYFTISSISDYTEFISNADVQISTEESSKKYQINLNSCSLGTKDYNDDNGGPLEYTEDRRVVDLWYKIIKDYEPHPVIEFKFNIICCLSNPTDFGPKHFDGMIDPSNPDTSPSVWLGIDAYDLHLPVGKNRQIKKYSGKFDEQSIRNFINEFLGS